MHISVPVSSAMEYINETKVSPLLSKVQIKVCYVGQEANRNGTVITKETARKFGENLPGTPIVGFYNEEKKDFDSHNREVVIKDGKYKLLDMTKPYGFVDIGAKVWFQEFTDDGVQHEYLCTEGYIWTGIYEESKRITEKGNNQSMELNEEYEEGFWSNDKNSGKRIFIISDGLIEKLCILGANVEPCFEGAQITSFSLNNPEFVEFKNTLFSMMNELKNLYNKGGSNQIMTEEKNMNPQMEEETLPTTDFEEKKKDKEEEKSNKQEQTKEKENTEGTKDNNEEEKDKKKEKNYELSDIAEYVALQLQYSELQSKYSTLEQQHASLTEEVNELRNFKLATNREEKEAMINSFYMLSDEDKKDVIDHLDTYSLDDIEAKLSIICVRNKVDFNRLGEEQQGVNSTQQYMLNLANNQSNNEEDSAPAWVRAVRARSN